MNIIQRALWRAAYKYPKAFAWIYRKTKWQWARLSRYIRYANPPSAGKA